MMNIADEQAWTVVYNRVKSDFQAKKKRSALIALDPDGKDLMDRLQALEKSLNTMKDSPMEYELTLSEIARRQVILENMKKQVSTSIGDPKQLLRPMNMTAGDPGADGSFNSHNNPDSINPLLTSDRALIQRQREVMKMQDEMLVDIEKGVDRLHTQAKDINQEAQLQNKIIDDLDKNVDHATEGLREETRHAEKIRIKSNTCKMYICVLVEALVLIALIFVLFVHI